MSKQQVMDFGYLNTSETEEANEVFPIETITEEMIKALSDYDDIREYVKFDQKWIENQVPMQDIIKALQIQHANIDLDIEKIQDKCDSFGIQSYQFIVGYQSKDLKKILKEIPVVVRKLKESPSPIDPKVYTLTRMLTGSEDQLKRLNEYAEKIGVKWSRLK